MYSSEAVRQASLEFRTALDSVNEVCEYRSLSVPCQMGVCEDLVFARLEEMDKLGVLGPEIGLEHAAYLVRSFFDYVNARNETLEPEKQGNVPFLLAEYLQVSQELNQQQELGLSPEAAQIDSPQQVFPTAEYFILPDEIIDAIRSEIQGISSGGFSLYEKILALLERVGDERAAVYRQKLAAAAVSMTRYKEIIGTDNTPGGDLW